MSELSPTSLLSDLQGGTAVKSERIVTGTLESSGLASEVKAAGATDRFGKNEMGKADFLKLLITSLQHQDPLDPAKNEEFIAQIAQFSTLENQLNMTSAVEKLGTKLDSLVESQNNSSEMVSNVSAASLLGRTARVETGLNLKREGEDFLANFNIHVNSSEPVIVHVLNSEDELVAVLNLNKSKTPLKEGDNEMLWDGKQLDGRPAIPGKYSVRVMSVDGTRETGYSYVEDKVTGIKYDPDGLLIEIGEETLPFDKILQMREGALGVTGKNT